MNTVTVSGWLHADPVSEHVGDLAVCELRLVVERPTGRPANRPRDRHLLRPARRPWPPSGSPSATSSA